MDHDEFARRAEALRARLYRTAYLYLAPAAPGRGGGSAGERRSGCL